MPLVANQFLLVNGYYYPYYSYGGYYYPSYSQPYLWSNGAYQAVSGTMPTPPNQGQPIAAGTAQTYQAPAAQVMD